ncbi:MAG: hypothetical protein ACK5HS_04560 [Mycoplasmatales bacterium]
MILEMTEDRIKVTGHANNNLKNSKSVCAMVSCIVQTYELQFGEEFYIRNEEEESSELINNGSDSFQFVKCFFNDMIVNEETKGHFEVK